ncbi:MAG: cellulase family glycosylhydrolase [Anaerolineales bacterium]|nr:cellulase family glycosylhydrolase [Anaerolineales bacterium]
MQLGVCYYPEHWPQERWAIDAKLMRQAGISLVRIAEFAWVLMEPREGEFNWNWLDQAIEVLAAEDLQVVLGTPTASPPPWLCRAHPDILPVDIQGRRRRYGSRRHYCANSTIYRQHTERIVSSMASRYGDHPAVVGWQIDNEFGCHDTARCYCETCAVAFRHWLETKYETINDLNQAWGTIFWSQTYGDWNEIDPPNLTIAEPNPSHVLDYYRFSSDKYVTYQQLQLTTLKSLISERHFVTTNFMSHYVDLNYHDLAKPLDFVTTSSYPTGLVDFGPTLYMPQSLRPVLAYDVGDPYITGLGHTLMRGFKPDRPFWVMEQQCGNVNWSNYNTGVSPGTIRLWTWHAIASGAEAVLYFRWRASLYAQEQFHSGLLHHDASSAVGYDDLESIKLDHSLMSEIASAPKETQIAFLLDYDSVWAVHVQPHHRDFDYMRSIFIYYRALQRLGLTADILSVDADLSHYEIIIVPAAFLATEEIVASLKAFAEAGGTVMLGVRSGAKTINNQFTDQPLPGLYRNLLGINVSDWHSIPPGISYYLSSSIPDLDGSATVWAESLKPLNSDPQSQDPDLQILAQYTSGPFNSNAALTERKVGAGRAFYLGWYPNEQQAEALLAYVAAQAGVHSVVELPDGLIAYQRGPYLILLNFTEEPQIATVKGKSISVGPRDLEVVNTNES